jgi:hypothetical protein
VSAYVNNSIQAISTTIYGYLYMETSTETISPTATGLTIDQSALTMLQDDLKNGTSNFVDTYGYFLSAGSSTAIGSSATTRLSGKT